MEPLLVPVWPDAGRALGLSRSTVYELISRGELASVKVGRRRLVPVTELRAFTERLLRDQAAS